MSDRRCRAYGGAHADAIATVKPTEKDKSNAKLERQGNLMATDVASMSTARVIPTPAPTRTTGSGTEYQGIETLKL